MIFKRREKPSFQDRALEILYPRKGALRGMEYIGKRIRRLPDSPHRIALGFACGAFASFTPFFGFHFVVAAAVAYVIRGNLLASAFGTAVGNPITFPFIATASLHTGWWITGMEGELAADLSFGWLTDNIGEIFWPYALGGILPGICCAILFYAVLGPIIAAYQERRRQRLAARAERLQAELSAQQDAHRVKERERDSA